MQIHWEFEVKKNVTKNVEFIRGVVVFFFLFRCGLRLANEIVFIVFVGRQTVISMEIETTRDTFFKANGMQKSVDFEG